MADYKIMTDSSCDLPSDLAHKLDLTVLPLKFQLDEKDYVNYLDEREISFKDFYAQIRESKPCITAAVNMDDWERGMRPILEQGYDVLVLAFSSGLSNTYNAARLAAEELSEEFKERKILVVDTLSASLGQGLLVYLSSLQKQDGKSLEEVYDYAEKTKYNLCHWFTVDDLHFLKRGGRVSSTVAVVGTMLAIKPVMHMDDEGHLINISTVRGRNASLKALVNNMERLAVEPEKQTVFISHGDCEKDANAVKEMVESRFGCKTVLINYVGPVIGAHSGPGTVALFFLGTSRL